MVTKPIKVDEEVKKILDDKKEHIRETYNDVLRRILKLPPIEIKKIKKEEKEK